MLITPPEEGNTPVAGRKRLGSCGEPHQSVDRLKKPFKITLSDDKENIPPSNRRLSSQRGPSTPRNFGTPQSVDRLAKPFKCPGSATVTRTSEKPTRKRRKVD